MQLGINTFVKKEVCPVCQKEGLESQVYSRGSYSTLLDWDWGEDPNTYTYNFECSRGHRWSISRQRGIERIDIWEKPWQ